MNDIFNFASASIGFIIALILIVVFIFMAINISVIKKKIDSAESIIRHYAIRDGLMELDESEKVHIPWKCEKCGKLHYRSETNCKRCGEEKPA